MKPIPSNRLFRELLNASCLIIMLMPVIGRSQAVIQLPQAVRADLSETVVGKLLNNANLPLFFPNIRYRLRYSYSALESMTGEAVEECKPLEGGFTLCEATYIANGQEPMRRQAVTFHGVEIYSKAFRPSGIFNTSSVVEIDLKKTVLEAMTIGANYEIVVRTRMVSPERSAEDNFNAVEVKTMVCTNQGELQVPEKFRSFAPFVKFACQVSTGTGRPGGRPYVETRQQVYMPKSRTFLLGVEAPAPTPTLKFLNFEAELYWTDR